MSMVLGKLKITRRGLRRAGRVGRVIVGGVGKAISRAPRGLRRRRRGRGITAAELRGFKKVATLLAGFGMRPRGLAQPLRRRRARFSIRKRGDPEDE